MELELRIDSLAAGGDGVGRASDGRVVFVPFTAPGDRVVVRVERERARFAHARLERVLEPGPARVEPRCAVFGRCGGCSWQHVEYRAQLDAKAKIVEDALTRIAGVPLLDPVRVVPSPAPWHYRSRTRVLVRGRQVGYRERRSHELCATERCPVLVRELEEALAGFVRKRPRRDGEYELVAGREGASISRLGSRGGSAAELLVAGERLRFSPGVFAQPNGLLLDELVRRVHEAAGSGDLALELFAGAGTFTVGLARRFARVVAVEGRGAAVADLEHNVAGLEPSRIRVVRSSVERALDELASLRPDAVLVDPPRSGLPAGCAQRIAALGARRLVYLSCDPATLARDLAVLRGLGLALVGVLAFDLFPQTPHVEVLALLVPERERRGGPDQTSTIPWRTA